ncbi:Uncharacterised protein [Proteus mirabilis]|uniref:Uncharacterized protein n=1 Tax=Proteus mirabilis TaxID=584 RepID=A0A2X2C2E7_PROMI|nr:Uncharacterised protein [Proteus mirabilis]
MLKPTLYVDLKAGWIMTLYISQQFVEQPVYQARRAYLPVYYHLVVSLGFLLRLVSSLKPELLLKRLHLRYQYLRGLRKNTSIRKFPEDNANIFLRCNARNGGLVHLNLFCNIGQNKGFHMLFTEFEKTPAVCQQCNERLLIMSHYGFLGFLSAI